jgi:hypothetical protein
MALSGHRLADQELLRALAGLVAVVDGVVVGRLVTVELAGLPPVVSKA